MDNKHNLWEESRIFVMLNVMVHIIISGP